MSRRANVLSSLNVRRRLNDERHCGALQQQKQQLKQKRKRRLAKRKSASQQKRIERSQKILDTLVSKFSNGPLEEQR